jgi:pyruvate/2-oxoglutarate dehydrogenase complex dihydrolipoamide acyltransferase (E2) component
MAATVKLPKFGLTMEEATLNEWLVAIGERVEQGQMLALLESEKVNLELPSPVSGIVAEYLVQIGETVPVGSPLAVIADAAEFEQSSTREA